MTELTIEQDKAIRVAILQEVATIRTYCSELMMETWQGSLDLMEILRKLDGIRGAAQMAVESIPAVTEASAASALRIVLEHEEGRRPKQKEKP